MKKFTLIELLVVIAIIGILTTILIPSLTKSRERSRSAVCMAQLHQLGITMFNRKSNKFMEHKHDFKNKKGIWMKCPWSRERAFPGDNSILKCPSDPKSDPHRWNPSYGYNFVNLNKKLMVKVSNPAETIFFAESDHKGFDNHILSPGRSREAGYHVKSRTETGFAPIGYRHYNGGNILWVDGHVSRISSNRFFTIHLDDEYWDLE